MSESGSFTAAERDRVSESSSHISIFLFISKALSTFSRTNNCGLSTCTKRRCCPPFFCKISGDSSPIRDADRWHNFRARSPPPNLWHWVSSCIGSRSGSHSDGSSLGGTPDGVLSCWRSSKGRRATVECRPWRYTESGSRQTTSSTRRIEASSTARAERPNIASNNRHAARARLAASRGCQ